MGEEQQYPAGWYVHPEGDTRWWDGSAWHAAHSVQNPDAVTPSRTSSRSSNVLLVAITTVAAITVVTVCTAGVILATWGNSEAYEAGQDWASDANSMWSESRDDAVEFCTFSGAGNGDYEVGSDEYNDFVEGCLDELGY